MKKGRIIFLNGVTSAGKTSIVEALQERNDIFFYVVANDLFQEMIGDKYLRENYWKYLSEVIIMMYHTAKLVNIICVDPATDNARAMHFWQKVGFVPIDVIENYDYDDKESILMVKRVGKYR